MASVESVEEELKVPMRVQLIVEPTPFTHVSGYANRFKEYLKYQKKCLKPDEESHHQRERE